MKIKTQDYQNYTKENLQVWRILFERQVENLKNKACVEYLESIDILSDVLNADEIVNFEKLDKKFNSLTGWSIEVVDGLIPVDEFFELLSRKKFPSSTWLRKKDQLDYLEEPDMFHDIFGHVPQLVQKDYSNFMQKFGEIGYKNKDNPEYVKQLQRLYWYTIEFGLLSENGKRKIYGAGIISSYKETNHIFETDIEVIPYNIKQIMDTEFIISDIQSHYFEIESYKQLYTSLFELS
ncbi:phenylalanine 4-monooxygenase [Abyssalbus ytuae]|uniref:Phenylalanine 4-monooxygenase n=1 Tax=Abyssalbus ytuae TaxID=2926907 RepID=A0A9E6ZSR2_9FLAO|nr:phenylalanine 4-monooxygenase [Abyssalbus ytuae]UOB18168.1 phenylalanine 4-monooxygenase [Abyssalbus ytuae]